VDVLKLWKGLFYALWMCDRPLPQQALCAELADLVFILPSRAAVVTWLRGFWATLAREWTGIDVLRLDKFLLLVRRVVGAGFKWMRKETGTGAGTAGNNRTTGDEGDGKGRGGNWDAERVDDILGLLEEWPFALADEAQIAGQQGSAEGDGQIPQTIPAGLRLHVLDIWVDEAEKVGLLEEGDEEASGIIQRIIGQVDALEQATTRPAVRVRSKESLSDERLPGNRKPLVEAGIGRGMDDGPGDSGSWDGFED
jgi:ribosomal RNA-processing protein 1